MNIFQGIIVALVWIFIIGQAIIFSSFFLPLLFQHSTAYFYVLSFFVSLFFTLFCYSYWKTTFTSPGSPSQHINSYYTNLNQIKQIAKHQQDIKHGIHSGKYPNLQTQFDQIQSLQKVSYCFKCQRIKQIRAHHCRTCENCVLRMDHHCPWVGNCVGKYNHKYFLLFLMYGSILVILVSLAVLSDYLKPQPLVNQLSINKIKILYASIFVVAVLGLAVIFLFGAQIYMLSMNLTTIQSFVNGMNIQQPFRKATFSENMEQIMGDSVWFLPSPPFRIQNSHHSFIQL